MSDAYDRMLKRADLRRKKQDNNQRRQRVLDDSMSSENEIPNVLGEPHDTEHHIVRGVQQKSSRQLSQMQINPNKSVRRENPMVIQEHNNDVEIVDDDDLNRDDRDEDKAQLNLFQSFRYFLGLYTTQITYPRKQRIYVDCNDPLKPGLRSPLNNDFTVNPIIVAVFLFFRQFLRGYILIWLAIVVLGYVIQNIFRTFTLSMYPSILLGLLVVIIILNGLLEHLMLRNRRVWKKDAELEEKQAKVRADNEFGNFDSKYKVYHHFGESAQWTPTQSSNLHAGQIIKVPPGKYFPCDCLILHCKQSLVSVQIDKVFPTLTYHPELTMKQTVIKADIMLLPISGQLETEQVSSQFMSLTGQLILTSPVESKYNISIENIALRGYKNTSQCEVLCMAMSTGVQNFSLRQVQYPMVYSTNSKHATLTDYADRLILITLAIYIVSVGLTILFHYIYIEVTGNPFYVSVAVVDIWKILIHLLVNYVIFVPILMKTCVLMFIYVQGVIIEKSCKVNDRLYTDIKDYNSLEKISDIDTIITSIDCLRNKESFTMHSFRVKEIHHVFGNGKAASVLDNELYGVEDLDLIKYFMSVALLTTHTEDHEDPVTGYEKAIQWAAKESGVRMQYNRSEKCTIVNNEQFRVNRMFKIPMTYHRPYCMYFYKPMRKRKEDRDLQSQESQIEDDRILCLVRGDPVLILQKVYRMEVQMSKWSKKMKQEKGYKVELIGKLTLKMSDLEEIERAYRSGNMQLSVLAQGLERYICRVETMGLLVFNNQFSSNKLNAELFNIPLLLRNQHRLHQKYSQEKERKMIVLTPPSDSVEAPQFESIHTLTNLLQQAFHIPLAQVPQKLLHDEMITAQHLMKKLNEQKILILNGWNKKDVTDMIGDLIQGNKTGAREKRGKKSKDDEEENQFIRPLSYFEKDEYLFLMRKCEINISKNGFDLEKYSDIVIKDNQRYSFSEQRDVDENQYRKNFMNLTPSVLKRLLNYDSPIMTANIERITLNQFTKTVMIIVIEIVASFYTWGTGILMLSASQYLLLQLVCFLDILYYFNFSHQRLPSPKESGFVLTVVFQTIFSTIEALFIVFVTIYSLETITNSSGTTRGRQFTSAIMTFSLINFLILRKLFLTPVFSLYRAVCLVIQIAVYYIGMIIISQLDTVTWSTQNIYRIFWYMFEGRMIVCGLGCVTVCLTVEMVRVILRAVFMKGYHNYYRKLGNQEKKLNNIKRVNYDVKLQNMAI